MADARHAAGRCGDRPSAATSTCDDRYDDTTPPITYRATPADITTASIVAELLHHIGDAVHWTGPVGAYARSRRDDLRAELRLRGAS